MPFRRRAPASARAALEREHSADPAAIREAALKMLERSRRTRADLERRLAERGFAADAVGPVLERLAGVGLVDDVEYARAYLRGRWGRRAAGWRRLEQELRGRGVAADDVARARAAFEADTGAVDEATAAARVVEQAARRYARLDPRVRRQRLWALLQRRGFDAETIAAALGRTRETDE